MKPHLWKNTIVAMIRWFTYSFYLLYYCRFAMVSKGFAYATFRPTIKKQTTWFIRHLCQLLCLFRSLFCILQAPKRFILVSLWCWKRWFLMEHILFCCMVIKYLSWFFRRREMLDQLFANSPTNELRFQVVFMAWYYGVVLWRSHN